MVNEKNTRNTGTGKIQYNMIWRNAIWTNLSICEMPKTMLGNWNDIFPNVTEWQIKSKSDVSLQPTCWHRAALSSQSRLVLGLGQHLGLGKLYLKQEWREWFWSHYPTLHWCRLSQTATYCPRTVADKSSRHVVTSSNAVHREAGTCLLRLRSSPWLNLPP